ncbi:MAG: hypothetical protein OEL53_14990 [Rhodospirillales bacterium]|nr:hypothetical protein [Rhodospirillales bacterium]
MTEENKENKWNDSLLWKLAEVEHNWTVHFLQAFLLLNGGALTITTTKSSKWMVLPSILFLLGLILSLFFIFAELNVSSQRRKKRETDLRLNTPVAPPQNAPQSGIYFNPIKRLEAIATEYLDRCLRFYYNNIIVTLFIALTLFAIGCVSYVIIYFILG